MAREHSANNSMDTKTDTTTADQGAAVLVGSGPSLGASELTKITTVTKWQTSDGTEHYSLESAQYFARQMDAARRANAVLDSGGSVADALRAGDWSGEIPAVLERVTKETKLVVEHWQCCSGPGYQVLRVRNDWNLHVWGNAGSWSGSYGGKVSVADLARYASHERTLFA